jgi:hypothetical protein
MTEFNLRHKSILAKVDNAFSQKKKGIDNLWQCIAEQFYPERAEFTVTRNTGDEFADHLSTSYPLVVRRDLGDSIGGMLRPRGQQWFKVNINRDPAKLDLSAQAWLENATKAQWRAMYDRPAQFTKATKEGDHDYAAFGQCVISAEVNLLSNTLLYRCWHLKDVAWCEDEFGELDLVTRKWKTDAANAYRFFQGKVHQKIIDKATKNEGKSAYEKVELTHVVIKARNYEYLDNSYGQNTHPYISIWFDCENKFVMEEKPVRTSYYIVPRWVTCSTHPYAYSPATVAGLPDARLIQAMTYTLLRAGEKAVDPPMIAAQDVIKSEVAIYPSGITWADVSDIDGKLENALQVLPMDPRSLPTGLGMQQTQLQLLESAFYINKLSMPPVTHEMTAEEARYRVQQYIRQALPLFEPIEQQYNAPICENTFELLTMMNAFGPASDIPESLQGVDVEFKFESPLIEARDQELARTFVDSIGLLSQAVQLDPGQAHVLNVEVALREALRGRGTPATWVNSVDDVERKAAETREAQKAAGAAQQLAMGGQAAEAVGRGVKAIEGEEAE